MKHLKRRWLALIGCALICIGGCRNRSGGETEKKYEKISDYLYYMELDDYTFSPDPDKEIKMSGMGCSSVRKGDLYGRNLDLTYGETPEFIIKLDAAEDRFASIGVCADPTITPYPDQMTEEELLSMPNITNDGINENGVIVSENIVDATGVDDLSGTAPGKDKLHASRVVRYLLDRAESAEHAVTLLYGVDIVGGFTGYALHFMIADADNTFVVEIIDGDIVVSCNEFFCMTNFYLLYGPVREEQVAAGTAFRDLPMFTKYPIGAERYCILRDGYPEISDAEGMADLLYRVRGTAMYDPENDPAWYTECCGGSLTAHAGVRSFETRLKQLTSLYHVRDRREPKGDWITWHSSVYEFSSRTLHIRSQENKEEFTFSLDKGRVN